MVIDKNLKMKLFPRDDSSFVQKRGFRQSEEIERLPDTQYKDKQAETNNMRKSYEPVSSSKVQVQSIQIAFETANKKKRNMSSNNSASNMLGLMPDGKEQLRKPMVISEAPDSQLDYEPDPKDGKNSKLLGKSKSLNPSAYHGINSSSSTKGFKKDRKRCQSAIPNKRRSQRNQNTKSNDSGGFALEVTGRPITPQRSKHSIDANASRKSAPKEVILEQ